MPMATEKSILLVDSENLVRLGLALLIESLGGYRIIGSVGTSAEALAVLAQHPPDIVLTEMALKGPSGIDLLLELKRRKISHPKVVLLYAVESAELIRRGLLLGAHGCLSKSSTVEALKSALDSTIADRRYIPDEVAKLSMVQESQYELSGNSSPQDPLRLLSQREREIFHLLAHGLQNTAIAKRLFISPRTVETHRARIVRKLELTSNAELIRFAFKHGLVVL